MTAPESAPREPSSVETTPAIRDGTVETRTAL
jgi:hypothetical protein